ncbi:DUF4350 domain-containing protein [Actinoplanes aureus]|uniref:DUF4350 domain-containing protein n=1 Tax=Actinoplanes aureus TaxID=2792083 RepID=A0A931C9M1_9ACTN|nr:DUF4350 domain-containing protein [Actinoplanes aureus]MBG0566004.1 DUF4350 domain-containing protein [Actinoplanes aureus]
MNRRWRVILPFSVLLLLVGGTLVVHAIEQPDPDDPAYLSPVSTSGTGASGLAGLLRDRGVTVERQTTTAGALAAAAGGDSTATIFVPTPAYAHLPTLTEATRVPAGTRLVLVAPDDGILRARRWPAAVTRTRWAAAPTDPACAEPVAGRAAVLRRQYATDQGSLCYDGGLLRFSADGYAVTLAGAADPFRNDRIAEHDNAALAVGLLAGNPRVIWLDLHALDVPPPPPATPVPTRTVTPDPTEGEPWGDSGGEGDGRGGEGQGDSESLQDSPMARAFPPAFWATVLLIVLALLALAAAAARRLGTPVSEPLPSRVPAHETMIGHGRLYARARARGPSLEILRAAARRRITDHLGLPADAPTDRIAGQAGLPAEYVRTVLDGDLPESDEDLVTAARFVQDLKREITQRPTRRTEGEAP